MLKFIRVGHLVGALALLALGAPATAQLRENPTFVPGELIVGYTSEKNRQVARQEILATKGDLRAFGSETVENLTIEEISGFAVKLRFGLPPKTKALANSNPDAERVFLEELASKIKQADSRVEYAHPNWIVRLDPIKLPHARQFKDLRDTQRALPQGVTPNDIAYVVGLHWHYQAPPRGMNATGAWGLSQGDRSVVVAVVDSGILFDQPDIKGSGNVLPGYNFVAPRSADATDKGDGCPKENRPNSWHGTHVAGTIGGVGTNNGRAVSGVNWSVAILPVRVLGQCSGEFDDIADGVRWAAGLEVKGVPLNKHRAQVINMSLEGQVPCTTSYLSKALDAARAAGSVVVAAAGNQTKDIQNVVPAGCPGVISVSAHDAYGRLTHYSNYGAVTIMAPGGDVQQVDERVDNRGLSLGVWSSVKEDARCPQDFCPMEGTSMAAPHVSGAIALALAKYPDWRGKPDLVLEKLVASVAPLAPGACPKPCGAGQLDAARLLQAPAVIATSRLDGAWLLADGEGILRIDGSEWRHPDKGLASLSPGREAGNYEVNYEQYQGIKCEYRISKLADGKVLALEAADAAQLLDYCPSGKLLKAD